MNSRTFPSGFRYYSKQINLEKAAPAFNFLYDPTLVWSNGQAIVTGGSRPATPSDFAANISLSGVSLQIGSVAVTGVTQTSIINNLLPVSGVVTLANQNSAFALTGSPLVTFSNSTINAAITGQPLFVTGSLINAGGTVNIASTGITNVTGSILSIFPSSTTVNNSTPSGINGVIIPANPNRKTWFFQNNATGYVFLKFGAGASSTSYNMVMKGTSDPVSYDGSNFLDEGARWKGDISVSGAFPLNYIHWELT